MRPKYPMLLDVRDRPIVIIGGGQVAARKAAGLREAGATRLRIVAPEFPGTFDESVQRVTETYRPEHLDGAQLIFAATDRAEVNRAVVRDARARGLFVCRADADDDDPGDFATPAQLRRGPVQVTVSTGSAALAVLIRDGIAQRWDDAWTTLAEATATIRAAAHASERLGADTRRRMFRTLASSEAVEIVRSRGSDGLFRWLSERYPGWDESSPDTPAET